ncbi:hypothetical protein [Enterobacter asburiae]|uniref:hypothetical protein n=1 Tax=Enterobacter asburiae TaxID=61645 RepID=UPI003BDF8876
MTNSITKIKALKDAIGLTKSVSGTINSIVEMVNHAWTHCGEPYPLPVGEYKRRAWLLADLERMLAQLVDEAHDEALRVNELLDTSALVVLNNRDAWNSASTTVKKLAVELAHSEAQEEDYRFNWLHNRWCLFHSSSRLQQEEIIGVAVERARQIIEAEEEYNAQKKWKLEAIWKHTHRDYKGESDGVRSILVCRNGTISVPLECLTDKEIEQRSSMWQRNK